MKMGRKKHLLRTRKSALLEGFPVGAVSQVSQLTRIRTGLDCRMGWWQFSKPRLSPQPCDAVPFCLGYWEPVGDGNKSLSSYCPG